MSAKRQTAPAEQPSLGDDVHRRRDEAIVKRLETMRNLVLDLESKLPAWRRELDGLIEELRQR